MNIEDMTFFYYNQKVPGQIKAKVAYEKAFIYSENNNLTLTERSIFVSSPLKVRWV